MRSAGQNATKRRVSSQGGFHGPGKFPPPSGAPAASQQLGGRQLSVPARQSRWRQFAGTAGCRFGPPVPGHSTVVPNRHHRGFPPRGEQKACSASPRRHDCSASTVAHSDRYGKRSASTSGHTPSLHSRSLPRLLPAVPSIAVNASSMMSAVTGSTISAVTT